MGCVPSETSSLFFSFSSAGDGHGRGLGGGGEGWWAVILEAIDDLVAWKCVVLGEVKE